MIYQYGETSTIYQYIDFSDVASIRLSYRPRLTALGSPLSGEPLRDVSPFRHATTFALLGIRKREDTGVLRWLAHSDIITPRCINTIHGREHGGFAVACIAVLHDGFRGWDTTVNTAESAKPIV